MAERLIFVRTAKGLQDLIVPVGDYLPFVNDFLAFLDQTHGRRKGREKFVPYVHRSSGIEDEVGRDLIAVFGVRRLGGKDF